MKARVGMRVHIFDVNHKDMGLGTIKKVSKRYRFVKNRAVDYPERIVADSGKVFEGLTCWWHPVTEKVGVVCNSSYHAELCVVIESSRKATSARTAKGLHNKHIVQLVTRNKRKPRIYIVRKKHVEVLGNL